MNLFSWFWGKRTSLVHTQSDTTHLTEIADEVDFTREGRGSTIVHGSVGIDTKLHIRENSSLTILRNIAAGCTILKESHGTLTIEGTVADDLKLTVYGRGAVAAPHPAPALNNASTRRPLENTVNPYSKLRLHFLITPMQIYASKKINCGIFISYPTIIFIESHGLKLVKNP